MAAFGVETKLFVTTYLASLNTRRKFNTLAPSSVYSPSVGENGWPRNLPILTMYITSQIQPYLFEPLASGHDSSDSNSRESDLVSEDGD